MRSEPMALYQIFYDDDSSFSSPAASSAMLEALARSRYISRKSDLLVINDRFSDLAQRGMSKRLKKNQMLLSDFAHKCSMLVLIINTHASPANGGLLYDPKKVMSLQVILDYVCPQEVYSKFTTRVLFIVCCGGFVQHSLHELKESSALFSTVFAFDAPSLDPITISNHFISTVLDFHVFGREHVSKALERALKPEVLSHTSVYAGWDGQLRRISDAAWRRRPNGVDIRCCGQAAKYISTVTGNDFITFHCQQSQHKGARTFRVRALKDNKPYQYFVGHRGKPRYMVSIVHREGDK
ncbi:uncharacterized protein LAESUDRAFT_651726 [Laetiporus sulphureus 93-53]|uniref:Uncharacterized protein n=1 Tax=Laetiporus sulphureus 93-53 TaxID=1314785 RepID=A0A165EJ18_9APHY|nr:uncharacterized protein LAESUDRAFT_651726 [Laetiporus sulphureus 93-53]KZT07152.1 hypothetical protein LAESUDRAFT_651726 [Laetiporus sulphureus 93-53]